MKNPMQKLRRFFVRSRTYKATAAQAATHASHDEDDGGNRLSGAFLVVLLLHVIAVVGVFAFARIKENRIHNAPPENPAPKTAAKPAAAKPPVPSATTAIAAANPPVAPHDPPKAPASGSHATHIVKENDTLTKIATAYNVGVPDLISANKLKNPGDIHPGQALTIPGVKQQQKIPAATEGKPAQTAAQKNTPAPADRKPVKTYVVRKGDTPLKIAREHGCNYDDLMRVNSIKDPKKIQTGQVLKLPVKNG